MASPAPRQPAHRSLFISLISDAALFPPAQLSMDAALAGHERHRGAGHADLVGPFLLGVPAVSSFIEAIDAGGSAPPAIGLVARPGTPTDDVNAALATLRAREGLRVVSLDAAWSPRWRSLDLAGLTVHLEVGREDQDAALSDIASASDFADLRAKFRTGQTPQWPWPTAPELATFLTGAIARHLPFVLTGGLHHAVRGEHVVHGEREQQHGLLNVLVAVHTCAGGADSATVRELLEIRDAGVLADVVAGWSSPDITAVRASFVSYGCCDVTDPIGELAALGLLTS